MTLGELEKNISAQGKIFRDIFSPLDGNTTRKNVQNFFFFAARLGKK
jgi:hypothetical protein